jgi:hypothetical protein
LVNTTPTLTMVVLGAVSCIASAFFHNAGLPCKARHRLSCGPRDWQRRSDGDNPLRYNGARLPSSDVGADAIFDQES